MKFCILALLFSLDHTVLATIPNTTSNDNCQRNCTTVTSQMRCRNCIPQNISDTVSEVILTELSADLLVAHGFCNVSWENVRTLSVVVSEYQYFADITNYAFDCLNKITTLKLSLPHLVTIHSNSFYGLDNVKVLEFNDCNRLKTSNLTIGLSSSEIIPNLISLTLNNMGTATDEGVKFSQSFVDAISQRNVSELNLISTKVQFKDANMDKLCSHLKLLNLSNTHVVTSKLPKSRCDSLATIDFSRAWFSKTPKPSPDIPLSWPIRTPHDERVNEDWMYFFSGASVIFLNRLYPNPTDISEVTLTVLFNNTIEELHISGYHFQSFEVEFIFLPNKMKYLDLSVNKIERMSYKTFAYLEYLEKLDLSNNQLGIWNELSEISSALFQNNSRLEYISLAENVLKEVPPNLFHMNKRLKILDLARNEISHLNTDLSKLTALESIDLCNNSIKYLDQRSREQIDLLLEKQKRHKQRNNKKENKLIVDLRNNPLSCHCEALDFLHWFVDSPIFDSTRGQYSCEIDGLRIPLNAEAIVMAEKDCNKVTTLLLSVLIPVMAFGLLIIVLGVVFKKLKERRTKQRFTDIISLMQENKTGYKFLIFLSFASKDDSFVLANVLQPLKETLKSVIRTERDLVAIGDLKFKVGRSIFSEAVELLEQCAVVVVVLSKNYCESDYCKMEIEQARLMNKPIVLILQGDVSENDMNTVIKSVFHHFTRIIFKCENGTYRFSQDWSCICQSIISVAVDTYTESSQSNLGRQLIFGQCCARPPDKSSSTENTGGSYVIRSESI